MKKRGYTLTEAVIALGIVGVVAALLTPLVNSFKPDPVKVMYLRTYDAIVDVVRNLANDNSKYPPGPMKFSDTKQITEKSMAEYPFFRDWHNGAGGSNPTAMCENIASSMRLAPESDIKCGIISQLIDDEPAFVTIDGIKFKVLTYVGAQPENEVRATYQTEIKFKLPNIEEGKIIDGATVSNPYFTVVVSADGLVKPACKRGQLYLKTRTNWKKDPNIKTKLQEMQEPTGFKNDVFLLDTEGIEENN